MVSRRSFLQSSAAAVSLFGASRLANAWAANAPGVTDAEIKIGQTMPYSGPASAYGTIGRATIAYFKIINEAGGINGRNINLISLDDGYSPPKTVEQTRRLIEQERVAFVFGSVGTPTNSAILSYLNDNKVPQLFIASGGSMFADPKHFPWTMIGGFNYQTEAHIFAKHILATRPDAKIGLLYQNDGYGKDYLVGLHDTLGSAHARMIIKEVSYEVTEPVVESQIVTLQGAGVDTLIIAATSKAAAQAIRKSYDIGWEPLRYLNTPASSIAATLKPAGLEKSKGLISSSYSKDPSDPRWKDDPGYREWVAFVTKSMMPADLIDFWAVYGWNIARMLVQVLKQCGDDLSRENIMRQAGNLKDLELPMLLPGITINTSPENNVPIRQLQLVRFTGVHWELFDEVMSE